MAENVIFFMINISGDGSFSSGGTSFLSSSDSFILSSQSGYISTPLPYRSESLEVINWTECKINPEWHPALSGTALALCQAEYTQRRLWEREVEKKSTHKRLNRAIGMPAVIIVAARKKRC